MTRRYTERYTAGISEGSVQMDNRSQILARALDLFSRRGYEGVGVQEIAESSGLTKPTLYHYFGSKAGLLQALLDEYAGRLSEAIKPAAVFRGDLSQSLDAVAEVYFRFARAHPEFFRLQLALTFASPASDGFRLAEQVNLGQYGLLEALFAQGTAQAGNLRGKHSLAAALFLGTLHSAIGWAINGRAELDEALRRRVVHQFQHGIYS